jgi:hypothetical protein
VTYIPMACGFLYLVAIIDWASRAVLAWRLSNTNDASFCAAALEEALLRFGKPRIFNTVQGSTFTAEAFTSKLVTAGVMISMDGRGRFMDNISLNGCGARSLDQGRRRASESLRRWLRGAVRHQFLDELLQFSAPSPGDEQPDADGGVARRHGQNRGGGEGCGYAASLGQRKPVAHRPTAEAARSGSILEGQRQARLHLKFNHPWSHEWGPVQTDRPQVHQRADHPFRFVCRRVLLENGVTRRLHLFNQLQNEIKTIEQTFDARSRLLRNGITVRLACAIQLLAPISPQSLVFLYAQPRQNAVDLVDDRSPLSSQILPFSVRTPRFLIGLARDRNHRTDPRLAP